MKTLNPLLAAALLCAAAVPASAAQFDFYKLKSPVGGSDFLPSGPSFNCTGGDKCSSNVDAGSFGGVLSYSNAGISLDASGSFSGGVASAVQDHENGWSATVGAGLGVYHKKGDTSDDNITSGETLTVTFDQVVTLTAIGLRSEGHNYTSWGAGKTFLLDGVSTLLPQNVGSIAVNMTGQVFTFAYGGANADQFYLSSLTAVPVPEPESWAMMLAGLGVVGFMLRRRTA
ncbi:MAG TPA: PEPxxWA-CTERM sorting domain-containing protein [Burkholderiaceae bacterium]|nr:PEPxxWA-CTERM sorting domain-containing protein [Burkholderiaceae bacterium]